MQWAFWNKSDLWTKSKKGWSRHRHLADLERLFNDSQIECGKWCYDKMSSCENFNQLGIDRMESKCTLTRERLLKQKSGSNDLCDNGIFFLGFYTHSVEECGKRSDVTDSINAKPWTKIARISRQIFFLVPNQTFSCCLCCRLLPFGRRYAWSTWTKRITTFEGLLIKNLNKNTILMQWYANNWNTT